VSAELSVLRAQDKRVGAVCSSAGTVWTANDVCQRQQHGNWSTTRMKAIEGMIDATWWFDILGARVVRVAAAKLPDQGRW
jgi:molybdopterin synthase catalytic subunit